MAGVAQGPQGIKTQGATRASAAMSENRPACHKAVLIVNIICKLDTNE